MPKNLLRSLAGLSTPEPPQKTPSKSPKNAIKPKSCLKAIIAKTLQLWPIFLVFLFVSIPICLTFKISLYYLLFMIIFIVLISITVSAVKINKNRKEKLKPSHPLQSRPQVPFYKLKLVRILFVLTALITISASFFFLSREPKIAHAEWWNDNWSYRKILTINSEYVAGDLTNFPVLVSLTDSSLSTHAQEDADDFVFTLRDGTKLSHEIESYASSTGALVAWVKMPSLSSNQDTDIFMYYGNQSVADQSDAVNVWDENYNAVYHLNDTGGTLSDATINNRDAVRIGTNATSTGKIAGAHSFLGAENNGATSTNWGQGGQGYINWGQGNHDYARSIDVDNDNNIYVAGNIAISASNDDWRIMKFDSNGATSTDWGWGGYINWSGGTADDNSYCVIVNQNKESIIYGRYWTGTGFFPQLMKFDSNGATSTDWGWGGYINWNSGSVLNDRVITTDSDGNLYVLDQYYNGSDTDWRIRKYDSTGATSTDFGFGGYINWNSGDFDYPKSIVVDSDNNLYVAGYYDSGPNYDWRIMKFDSNGATSTDWGWGNQGFINWDSGSGNDYCTSIVVDSDNNLYVAGYYDSDSGIDTDYDWRIMKFDSNGATSTNWGWGGYINWGGGNDSDYIWSIAIDEANNIYVAGEYNNGSDFDWRIMKFDSNGATSTNWGWGNQGFINWDGGGIDRIKSIVLDLNSNIYVAGEYNNGSDYDWRIMKFMGTDDWINAGDTGGVKTVSFWVNIDTTTEKIIKINSTVNIEVSSGTVTANGFSSPTIYVDGQVSSTLSTGWHQVVVTTGTALSATTTQLGKIDSNYLAGVLDEVRFLSKEKSADWIETSYNNQNDPAAFFAEGTEETGPGPVGYWSFDEGHGTTAHDESGQGNDGTITGATWVDESQCISGKCLYFDGSGDYVNCGSAKVLDNLKNDFTAALWFKASTLADGKKVLVEKFTTGEGFNIDLDNSHLEPTKYGIIDYDNEYRFATNTWYYLSVVFSSDSGISVYVNGANQGINSNVADLNNHDNRNFTINRSTVAPFHGYIDEVKIYPYARSADEIRQDYNAGLSGITSPHGVSASFGGTSDKWLSDGLVGYWKFDENATTSGAIDSSGNGNTGTYYHNASTTAGKYGRGGVFASSSNDYIDVENDIYTSDQIKENGLTLATWVRIDKAIVGSNYGLLGGAGSAGHSNYTAGGLRYGKGSSFAFFTFTIYSNSSYESVTTTADDDIQNDTWYFLTGTINPYDNKQKLYLNGTLIEEQLISVDAINYGATVFNMGRTTDTSDYSNATLDEVRIYNRALSPTEVRRLYEWAPGPVAHWKFDEMTGTTTYDSIVNSISGGGHDGQLQNMDLSTAWTQGKYGSALSFDGDNDSVLASNLDETANLYGLTVSAWVKLKDSDASNNWGRIIQYGSTGGLANWYLGWGSDGLFEFSVRDMDSNVSTADSDSAYTDVGVWHYITGKYNGSNVLLYCPNRQFLTI